MTNTSIRKNREEPIPNRGINVLLKTAMNFHLDGKLEMADELYGRVLDQDRHHPDALHLKGVVAFQHGRYGESVELISRAIQEDSTQAAFYNNLGNTFNALGKSRRAVACFKKAVKSDPTMADAVFNLANVQQKQGEFDNAIEHYKIAIKLNPDCANVYNNLGIAYDDKGMTENATDAYRMAIRIDPNFVDAYNNLFTLQEGAAQLDAALETARAALEIDPESLFVLLNLAQVFYRLQRYRDAEKVLKKCFGKELPTPFYARFYYLLGKINNRMDRFDNAFESFTKANQSILDSGALAAYGQNNPHTLREIDETRNFFSAQRIRRWRFSHMAGGSVKQAFLVGFPRSGTTLLEQILNTHDSVATLDEQPIFEDVFRMFRHPADDLERLDHLTVDEIERYREHYFDRAIRKIKKTDALRLVVDKLPLNILYLGVIYRFFPDAKIIVALRHPLGCVLSGFMQQFKMNRMMFNFLSIEASARFYAAVMGLYLHYHQILPLQMHRIRYEDMVEKFEYEIRKLFEFLDLEWQGMVLDYHTAAKNRKINTPSYSQVVKPIYHDAANRWHKYRAHLTPALEWVKPFIQSFGYDHPRPNTSTDKMIVY